MAFFRQEGLSLLTHSNIQAAIASALYTNKYGKIKAQNQNRMKVYKVFVFLSPVSYTHLDVYKRQEKQSLHE